MSSWSQPPSAYDYGWREDDLSPSSLRGWREYKRALKNFKPKYRPSDLLDIVIFPDSTWCYYGDIQQKFTIELTENVLSYGTLEYNLFKNTKEFMDNQQPLPKKIKTDWDISQEFRTAPSKTTFQVFAVLSEGDKLISTHSTYIDTAKEANRLDKLRGQLEYSCYFHYAARHQEIFIRSEV